MRRFAVVMVLLSIVFMACTQMQVVETYGNERQLRAATERYFDYVQHDLFDKILDMSVPESEYYRRMKNQMRQMKTESGNDKELNHEFTVESMEIIEDVGIVEGVDKVTGYMMKNGTRMPIDMSVDFTLKFRWHDDSWMLYTTD